MRGRWTVLGGVLAAWLAAAGPPAAGSPGAGAVPEIEPRFSSVMPDRFGVDEDGDGTIDMPNTAEYVQGCPEGCRGPVRFTLQLDASASRARLAGEPLDIVAYRWWVSGPGGVVAARVTGSPRVQFRLPEGTYRVALDVQAALGWGTATARAEREVEVEDLLVVAMGDSYASGDGNPEEPRSGAGGEATWGDSPGDAGVEAAHAAAHRSTAAWPSLVALALERADPGSSVTFVSVAATGARVSRDLAPSGDAEGARGQVGQIADLVGERRIDTLLVSAGGNDVGFPLIVRGLVDADPQADPVCYDVDVQNVWRAVADGNWNRGSALRFSLPGGLGCQETQESGRAVLPGLAGLPDALDALAGQVEAALEVERVYLVEYPDPTGAPGPGAHCLEIAGDLTPPFCFHEIDQAEQEGATARVLDPLNRLLEQAAKRHGWRFVGGVAEAFAAGHGYCAPAPRYEDPTGEALGGYPAPSPSTFYRHPGQEDLRSLLEDPGLSWYRTAAQSAILQGPLLRWETTGTLHPNELGHSAMAAAVLAAREPGGS